MFSDIKNPCNIEAEKDIAFAPFTGCFADKCFFCHAGGVGEMQLEYMATGFNIKAKREGVNRTGNFSSGQLVIVFCIKAYPL